MDDLWDRWRKHYKNSGIEPKRICQDGIVDERRFAGEKLRILYVLREANDWEGGDIREWLAPRRLWGQMAHNLARWSWGILHGLPLFEEIGRLTMDRMLDALRRVAAINLKKASGGASSDPGVINAYAAHDRSLLVEQIDGINPNLIIACGTIDPLIWLLNLRVEPEDPYKVCVEEEARNATVVPFHHPSSRRGTRHLYEALHEKVSSLSILKASTKREQH